MGARERSPERLDGDLLKSRNPCAGNGEGCGRRPILGSPKTMGQRQSPSHHHTA